MSESEPPRDLAAAQEIAADSAAGYQAIGRFMVDFSGLELMMRVVLGKRLNLKGAYFDIVVSPYDFATLCRVTSAVLRLQFPEQTADIDKFVNDCLKLNDERVRVAHGTWALGDDFMFARHVQRATLKPKLHFKERDALSKLAEEAQRLSVLVFKWNPQTAD